MLDDACCVGKFATVIVGDDRGEGGGYILLDFRQGANYWNCSAARRYRGTVNLPVPKQSYDIGRLKSRGQRLRCTSCDRHHNNDA